MKCNQICRRITALLLTVLLLAVMLPSALAADTAQSGSITGTYVLPGVTFNLYAAGSYDQVNGKYVLGGVFEGLSVDPNDDGAAATLAAYTAGKAHMEAQTDASGKVVFSGLSTGLYLLTGETTKDADGNTYVIQPMLISIPGDDGDGAVTYDRQIVIKYEKKPYTPETTKLEVTKVWKDNDNAANKRPTEIRVDLLRDGEYYETVTLNKDNNWRYSWDKLDPSYSWTVREAEIPAYYTAEVTPVENGYVITNTWGETPPSDSPSTTPTTSPSETPSTTPSVTPSTTPSVSPTPTPNGSLPKTGLVWWPALVLLIAGIFCVVIGVKLSRRGR